MGYLIPLRRGVLKFLAAGAAVAEVPVAGDLDLGRDDVFLEMVPVGEDILIAQRMTAIRTVFKSLFHGLVDVVGGFPAAAGLTGLLAPLFEPFAGAPGRLEMGLALSS